jgi:hypothetical protein
MPDGIRRAAPVYNFARLSRHDRSVSVAARFYEARARQSVRRGSRLAVALLRAGHDLDDVSLDILPTRHRGKALW